MNGSLIKVVIDTNILFMAAYGRSEKAAKTIQLANRNKILLFAPDIVREELTRLLKRKMNLSGEEIAVIFEGLPITWIEKEFYQEALDKTKVKHKADKPIEALASILDCGILTADKHFDNNKRKIDIDDFLKQLGD